MRRWVIDPNRPDERQEREALTYLLRKHSIASSDGCGALWGFMLKSVDFNEKFVSFNLD